MGSAFSLSSTTLQITNFMPSFIFHPNYFCTHRNPKKWDEFPHFHPLWKQWCLYPLCFITLSLAVGRLILFCHSCTGADDITRNWERCHWLGRQVLSPQVLDHAPRKAVTPRLSLKWRKQPLFLASFVYRNKWTLIMAPMVGVLRGIPGLWYPVQSSLHYVHYTKHYCWSQIHVSSFCAF